jgi:hypothetical protein
MIFTVEYMQFKTCLDKVSKLKLTMLILHQSFSQPATVLVVMMRTAGMPLMECVITNIHCPVFLTCYICHLSFHISQHFAKAVWPYYPRWLYFPQVLYLAILYLPHSTQTALGLYINAIYGNKHCLF